MGGHVDGFGSAAVYLLMAIQVYHFEVVVAIFAPLSPRGDVMLVNVLSVEEGFAASSADMALIPGDPL